MKKILLFGSVLMMAGTSLNAQTRNCLIEEFTSSTCPPCKAFNLWFDPLLITEKANVVGSNLVVVKYQMDFPSPGNDVSFNADCDVRAGYYHSGSWGIPTHRTNGPKGTGNNSSSMTSEIASCKGGTSNYEITGKYTVKANDSIYMDIVVKPTAAASGNFKVHVLTAEKHYQNPGNTTGQLEYYHVMRKMYPSSAGTAVTAWVANTPQTFKFADKVNVTTVTQNSSKFWNSPKESNIVVFVQDEATKNIMQSQVIAPSWATDVKDAENNVANVMVYPNPATDRVYVMFTVAETTEVSLTVVDMMGRVVESRPAQKAFGSSQFAINTEAYANGTYTVIMQSASGKITERFSVAK
jgi:hypothetical protein